MIPRFSKCHIDLTICSFVFFRDVVKCEVKIFVGVIGAPQIHVCLDFRSRVGIIILHFNGVELALLGCATLNAWATRTVIFLAVIESGFYGIKIF